MIYIPKKGDIVWLDFDPSCGKEIIKRRPAFIISQQAFNEHTQMIITAPITSTIRGGQLEVALSNNLQTKGAVLVYQLKAVDFFHRNVKFIEKAPEEITKQVSIIAQLLVQ